MAAHRIRKQGPGDGAARRRAVWAWTAVVALVAAMLPGSVVADVPWTFGDDTRFMAMGDSLTAGYGAVPATRGFAYQLYLDGSIDTVPDTLFTNAAVPGATSQDILDHQVPMAVTRFHPHVITLTVGGNDLLGILNGEDPGVVLATFQENLFQILATLRAELPEAKIVVGNLYEPPVPGADQIVPVFNQILAGVAGSLGVSVADVHGAFHGRSGLLLVERNGSDAFQVHPTNAGYRVMADAFSAALSGE